MTSLRELTAFAQTRPQQRRYQGAKKAREHSAHDEIQSALVQHFKAADVEGTLVCAVDFEVPCGRRWADVVIWHESTITIVEIKTSSEHWGAGDVVRQLRTYARLLPNRRELPVQCVLVHEGPLSAAEAFLLAAKQIATVQVDR